MKSKIMAADCVIVGAGSAGCVLASRLSENENVIILVEAWHGSALDCQNALGLLLAQSKTLNWGYRSEQSRICTIGGWTVLGGGDWADHHRSTVWYIRRTSGLRSLEALGAQGWGYDAVLPYFKKAQGSGSRGACQRLRRPANNHRWGAY